MKKVIITRSEAETMSVARVLLKEKLSGGVKQLTVFLEGTLGAGKTIFAKGIAKALGIDENVESPTFVFVREYIGMLPLYHFDLYRIERSVELDELGFFDYFERSGVIIIEWAEKIETFVRPNVTVIIEKIDKGERRITIENNEE